MKKDLLSINDLTKDEILTLIKRAIEIKSQHRNANRSLEGYTLGLIFEKASTRTRVSFEIAMFRLGGQTIFLNRSDTQMSRDENIHDTAKVLSRYIDALAIRTYSQALLEEMAKYADIPIINALSDLYHPCQVLSDLVTVTEKKGSLNGLKIAWIGDGNNVAHSWINAAQVMGFDLVLACPEGYKPSPEVMKGSGDNIKIVDDPEEAAKGAAVINTDVWASMGQESEEAQRLADFKAYQVDKNLVDMSEPGVIVMHCLPAHRGEEITSEVLDGPNSVVFDQAENKLHLHQALLEKIIAGSDRK
ncbi:MAG: ornithine carbamoyltransferase [Deltaproteobacteria bacterium]|nr:ornithine carbamoyltransferase [Deltaproteobacteria bacterium]